MVKKVCMLCPLVLLPASAAWSVARGEGQQQAGRRGAGERTSRVVVAHG